jgi:hypothetical protein
MKYLALFCYSNVLLSWVTFSPPSLLLPSYLSALCSSYFHEVVDLDFICTWIFMIILNLWQENMLVLWGLGWMVLKCLHVGLQLTLSPQR